jgi:hypothetical protein
MESVYWAFTRRCNDFCPHCYNESGPEGPSISLADAGRIVANLPAEIGRLILSGGEPLMDRSLLFDICDLVLDRFGAGQNVHIQTNGDLLDAPLLDQLEAHGVSRVDIVSIDALHVGKGAHLGRLEALLTDAGWQPDSGSPCPSRRRTYAFWGATDDLWLRGNWPRGRALDSGTARLDPDHNFCALWSGGYGFLRDGESCQEVSIQLHQVFPCCPGTWFDIGDAREQPIQEMLEALRGRPEWEAIGAGDPAGLPVPGKGRGFARERVRRLGSCCLWCDEFFREHYRGPHGERRPYR